MFVCVMYNMPTHLYRGVIKRITFQMCVPACTHNEYVIVLFRAHYHKLHTHTGTNKRLAKGYIFIFLLLKKTFFFFFQSSRFTT